MIVICSNINLILFQKWNMLFRKDWPDQPEVVEGKAISVINIAMFMGQAGAALLVGPVVDAVGDKNVLMLIPAASVAATVLVIACNNMPTVEGDGRGKYGRLVK